MEKVVWTWKDDSPLENFYIHTWEGNYLVLVGWSLRYCCALIGACVMCLVFPVTMFAVFVMHNLYDLPLWSSLPCSTLVQGVQTLPSSLWKVTVEPVCKETGSSRVLSFLELVLPYY